MDPSTLDADATARNPQQRNVLVGGGVVMLHALFCTGGQKYIMFLLNAVECVVGLSFVGCIDGVSSAATLSRTMYRVLPARTTMDGLFM